MKHVLTLLFFFLFAHLQYGQTSNCFDLSYDRDIEGTAGLGLLDEYSVFFLGETHNIGGNDLMDYALLTHLNNTQEVTHFIKEGTYSFIFLLAQYIETSDPQYLDFLGFPLPKEEREFVERLANFNKKVPEDRRIKVYGIDSEPFYHLPLMLNALLYKHGNPPQIVQETFEKLKSFQAENWTHFISKKEKKEIKEIWENVSPIVSANKTVFQEYLKDDLTHFMMVLDNSATVKRSDSQLLENFLKLQQLTGAEKFYFSYGSLHAQKKGGWLADQINKSSLFENKVFSIKTIYHQSTMLWGDQHLLVNTLEKVKPEEAQKVLSTFDDCSDDFALLSTMGLSYENEFDFLLLARNQNAITVESEKDH
ncbi:MAG: hypothetical protein R8G66_31765 [Cytophagales bacterium]|nr:hypothetical protein [Cytophagales bacterium]